MSLFRKPGGKKTGLKILVIGKTGTGKTLFSLTAPQSAILDSETGAHLYEETPEGKNLVLVANTQSYEELEEALLEILDNHESLGIKSVIIDSETKFHNDLTQAVMSIEEKKAISKGKDPLDSQLSIRSYGIIGRKAENLQNLKIDVSAAGVNVISVAQEADITKFDMKSGTSEVVGTKPKMKKEAEFDYDIVITLFTEGKGEDTKYFARIDKDRSKTFKTGQVIENPSFSMWDSTLKSMKGKEVLGTSLTSNSQKSKEAYEKEVEEEAKTFTQKLAEFIKPLRENDPEKAKEFQTRAVEEFGVKSFSKLTAKQETQITALMREFK